MKYRSSNIRELGAISFGFLLTSLTGFTFMIFELIKDDKYDALRTTAGIASISLGTIGFVIIGYILYTLTDEPLLVRHQIMIPFIFYNLGLYTLSQSWMIDGGVWNATFSPSWIAISMTLARTWITVEILLISIKSYKGAINNRKTYLLITIGWCLIVFATIFAVLERLFISDYSVTFLAIGGVGQMLVAIGMSVNPLAIIPRIVKGKYMIISEKTSGIPLYEKQFVSEHEDKGVLFSGAFTGIIALLKEITGQEEIPAEFGYVNYIIMMMESDSYIAFFVSERRSNPVRAILSHRLKDLERMTSAKMKLQPQIKEESLLESLQFAI